MTENKKLFQKLEAVTTAWKRLYEKPVPNLLLKWESANKKSSPKRRKFRGE